jgi:hypothetical protein
MKKGGVISLLYVWAVMVGFILLIWNETMASPPKAGSYQSKKCLRCHTEFTEEDDILTGDFQSRSNKAKSIQVKVNDGMQILKYTPDTEVENVKDIKALKKPIPVKVYYEKRGEDLIATSIVAKPVIKVPPEQLFEVEEVQALVAQGPEKGNFVLVDARPAIRYKEGHIPGAISIPFPKMLDMTEKLPKDKHKLIIYYCGGFR